MGRPRSDIPARIVRAARQRFLAEGVDGASLRAIAADARTSLGMISYYFPSKDDLFLAVVEESYAALLADLARALGDDVAVEERLRRLYRRIGAMSEVELTTLRLVVREALVSSRRLERLLERFRRGHVPLVLGAIADGMRSGAIDPRLPPAVVLLATLALGAVPQAMARVAGRKLPGGALPSGAALSDLLLEVLWRGVGRPPRRARRG